MPSSAPSGLTDAQVTARVRRMLRDQPVYFNDPLTGDGVNGAMQPGAKPFRLQRAPLYKGNTPRLTAPPPYTGGGNVLYTPVLDPPAAAPQTVPVISDAGAGTLPVGTTYQMVYTMVDSVTGESLPSPLSNVLSIAASHNITFASMSGFASTITGLRVYLVGGPSGTNAGRVATPTVTAGVSAAATISAAGNLASPAFMNADTGELIFPGAPAAGAINIAYQALRYTDQQVNDALYAGLYFMTPTVWQPAVDTSLLYSPTQVEYTLPAAFNNPRVKIIAMEVIPPGGPMIQAIETGMWRRIGLTTLAIDRFWPAGTQVRLTYNFFYAALSDLEIDAIECPCYYACYRLLMDQESSRTRQNDLMALTGEGSSQPQVSSNAAQLWLQLYEQAKQHLAVEEPYRSSLYGRSVELLEAGKILDWDAG